MAEAVRVQLQVPVLDLAMTMSRVETITEAAKIVLRVRHPPVVARVAIKAELTAAATVPPAPAPP